MEMSKLKNILEAVLLTAERTLSVIQLDVLFELDEDRPTRDEIRKALHEMAADYEDRGYQLKQVASGFRLQVRQEFALWVGRLWEEKPARYTRALLETMSLIAYRQPITRGEIEEVRGVSVSSNIVKTLLERDWIKVLGHKDVPGKPALYGTTREFLDYFNLKSLDQLPTLAEIKDLDSIHPELALDEDIADTPAAGSAEDGQNNEQSDDDSQDRPSSSEPDSSGLDNRSEDKTADLDNPVVIDDSDSPVSDEPVENSEAVEDELHQNISADESDVDESSEDELRADEPGERTRSA